MPSRAELRVGIERILRGASFMLLAWMLWLSMGRGTAERAVSAASANLGAAVRDWSAAGLPPDLINVQLDSAPSPLIRDWLRALHGAGSRVSWDGSLAATALSLEPIVAPRGGFTVTTASGSAPAVVLSDEVGPLDTAKVTGAGATFTIPAATGAMSAWNGTSRSSASLPDSARVQRVLVLGAAGWETKFVVAALEEDGWRVDASMRIAPGIEVTQGSVSPIDTSRYSAVIALDASAARRASEIGRYVASGGGLVLSGSAGSLDVFASLRPGAAGRMESPAPLGRDAATLRSLPVIPVANVREDAVTLERRGSTVAAAARRHMMGRVLQQGHVDTWRWRMSGGDRSVDEHRAWWSSAVASVARRDMTARTDTLDNAPVARLVEALGPPSARSGVSLSSAAGSVSMWWLFAALLAALLSEWASRRLRGAR